MRQLSEIKAMGCHCENFVEIAYPVFWYNLSMPYYKMVMYLMNNIPDYNEKIIPDGYNRNCVNWQQFYSGRINDELLSQLNDMNNIVFWYPSDDIIDGDRIIPLLKFCIVKKS